MKNYDEMASHEALAYGLSHPRVRGRVLRRICYADHAGTWLDQYPDDIDAEDGYLQGLIDRESDALLGAVDYYEE